MQGPWSFGQHSHPWPQTPWGRHGFPGVLSPILDSVCKPMKLRPASPNPWDHTAGEIQVHTEPWLLAPRDAADSRLRDENYFENQGQRPQAYICSRLLTRVCHGLSQSESNFINTVIKQKGNYFKYWKNVRVIHEFCGYHILFDTRWINDSKKMYSEITCTMSPTFKLNPSPSRMAQI